MQHIERLKRDNKETKHLIFKFHQQGKTRKASKLAELRDALNHSIEELTKH